MRLASKTAAFLVGLFLIGPFVLADPATAQADDPRFSPTETSEIERIVHDYLLSNPEILKKAFEALQAKEEAQKIGRRGGILESRQDEIFADPNAPFAGNPDGDVVIVEFFDYKCPYCKRVTSSLVELLNTDPKLKLVFKEFPILGEGSVLAARAALAAQRQDKYREFHEALMRYKGAFDPGTIKDIAAEIGLDLPRLIADLQAPEIGKMLEANQRLAADLAIGSTPTFIIGKEIMPGALPIEELRALIKKARQGS